MIPKLTRESIEGMSAEKLSREIAYHERIHLNLNDFFNNPPPDSGFFYKDNREALKVVQDNLELLKDEKLYKLHADIICHLP